MELDDKILRRLKLSASLRKTLAKNKKIAADNQIKGIENISVIDSIRQLEASSGLSYTIVQGVFAAERDIQFSSLVSIIEEGLGFTFTEFAKIYDSISDDDIKKTKKEIANNKRKKNPSKSNK